MRIGILGGSFDPLHKGHLFMAQTAYEEYNLDEIWLIPNGNAPHKDGSKMATPIQRYEMCKYAESYYPFIKVDDIEIISKERSFTYITLQKLTEMYPENQYYFIMGADSLDYFEKWGHPEIISSLCTLLVINRDEFTKEEMEEKIISLKGLFDVTIEIVNSGKYDISSTEIRSGEKLEELLPEIKDYIIRNHLYGF